MIYKVWTPVDILKKLKKEKEKKKEVPGMHALNSLMISLDQRWCLISCATFTPVTC